MGAERVPRVMPRTSDADHGDERDHRVRLAGADEPPAFIRRQHREIHKDDSRRKACAQHRECLDTVAHGHGSEPFLLKHSVHHLSEQPIATHYQDFG